MDQENANELQRYRAEVAGIANGLAQLSGLVVKIEAKLEHVSRAVDGNGRPPLAERTQRLEDSMKRQEEAMGEVENLKIAIALLVKDRDERRGLTAMVWGALIAALVSALFSAIPVLLRLTG